MHCCGQKAAAFAHTTVFLGGPYYIITEAPLVNAYFYQGLSLSRYTSDGRMVVVICWLLKTGATIIQCFFRTPNSANWTRQLGYLQLIPAARAILQLSHALGPRLGMSFMHIMMFHQYTG